MKRSAMFVIVACLAIALGRSAGAAILYSGGVYSQNFDTLPTTPVNASLGTTAAAQGWRDDTAAPAAGQFSIVGWYLYHPTVQAEGGISGNQRLRVSGIPLTAATGSFYSFGTNTSASAGTTSSTERAFGVVPSATLTPSNGEVYMGVRVTNNTTDTLTQFSFSYTGEQWRVATDTAAGPAGNESLTVDYRLGGTDLQSATYIEIPTATFDSPIDNVPGAATPPGTNPSDLDGNVAANRVTGLGATITGISWAPGTDLWLRWTGINKFTTGEIADHGLAIDDLTFIGEVPEPSAFVMAVAGAVALLAWRRK